MATRRLFGSKSWVELEDFLTLLSDLNAHTLDFGANVFEFHPSMLSGFGGKGLARCGRAGRKGGAA
jgi:hypothetical protein